MRHHQRAIWRFLRILGCEPHGLEDLMQDTFLAAVEAGVHQKPDPVARAWLRTTARNLFVSSLRRSGSAGLTDEQAARAAFEYYAGRDGAGDGTLDALRQCMERLPPRARHAIDRVYRDGAGRDELARELDLTSEGVKTLLRRVRGGLRECVEQKKGSWS